MKYIQRETPLERVKEVGSRIQVHCVECGGERNHVVLFLDEYDYSQHYDEGWEGNGELEQLVVAACCGCEGRAFLIRWQNSSDDGLHVSLMQFPTSVLRKFPPWFGALSRSEIGGPVKSDLLKEIYDALESKTMRLATLGIRALVEHMMIEKCGDNGSFEKNLQAFERDGYISAVQKRALGPVIEIGHASMHWGHTPPMEDILHSLDVIEGIISAIYVQPDRSTKIHVPPRLQRKKLKLNESSK
jgi:Domain of unknown function (DUF4145)